MTATPDYLASPAELQASLSGLGASDLVLLAAQALRVGSLEYAAAICESHRGPPDDALALTRAAALFGMGEHGAAIALVDEVLARAPQHLPALFYRAQMAQHAGDAARASELLLAVLQRFPDFPGAQGALASLRMPGPPYRDVLQRVHELLRPRTYLEVGVESGATLALAGAAQDIIGIDPDSSKLRPELVPPRARLFHETSDDFFGRHRPEQLLGAHAVDLAFIDGMHLFEFALRDFVHVERWCGPDATILLHDCLPVFPLTASRTRRTKFWLGDVWKLVLVLRDERPDLRVKIVATPPSGLCVVRGLDPSSTRLSQRLDAIVERYQERELPARPLAAADGFELVPATEAGLRDALR